jgi:tagatose 1,6-diphosphate aldolase
MLSSIVPTKQDSPPASTTFLDPGPLVDDDLQLVLVARRPPNLTLGFAPSYAFEMRHTLDGAAMGGVSLRIGEDDHIRLYAGHIGYGVISEYRGHHYAARACRLLRPLALRHQIETLWITCDPDNWASRRTCELAGARFVEIVRVPASDSLYALGHYWKCRYRLDAQDWAAR